MRITRLLVSVLALAAAAALLAPTTAEAAVITCPDPIGPYGRQFALGDAQTCVFGTGNATEPDVELAYGGDWTEQDSLESGDPAVGTYLTVTGSGFGQPPDSGTWTIAAAFWAAFEDAVISVHVGNAGVLPQDTNLLDEPDHFIFLITQNTLAGTWEYIQNLGGGGGISNFKLYSRGVGDDNGDDVTDDLDVVDFMDDVPTPEPGTLLLLGLGIGIGAHRAQRRSRRR